MYKTATTIIKLWLRDYETEGEIKIPNSNNMLDIREVFEFKSSKVTALFRSKGGILIRSRFY